MRIDRIVKMELDQLERKYPSINPFDKYAVGGKPATEELLMLIKEHRLSNGQYSSWLTFWQSALEWNPYLEGPLPIPNWKDTGTLARAIRTADSAIKHSLVSTKGPKPTESWTDFIQRLFEKEWIQPIAEMAFGSKKEANPAAKQWDLQTFEKFINDVVKGLNELGYQLKAPVTQRLKTLFNKVHNDEKLFNDDSW